MTATAIENAILARWRHSLSPYRRRVHLAKTVRCSQLSPFVGTMNRFHRWLCRSDCWRSTIAQRLSWAIGNTDLGPNVLELGPGPGLTTDLLRISVPRLTALEIDPMSANSLNSRLKGNNVKVIEGDATEMPFADSEFSGAVSFTMLHHIPSPQLQDKVLAEVFRVLKPGGLFVGSDGLQSWFMRIIHIGDTLVPVSPDTFGARLQSAGFEVLEVQKNSQGFRFRAQRPSATPVNTRNWEMK
jgi:SAM-dependent methyltransferase